MMSTFPDSSEWWTTSRSHGQDPGIVDRIRNFPLGFEVALGATAGKVLLPYWRKPNAQQRGCLVRNELLPKLLWAHEQASSTTGASAAAYDNQTAITLGQGQGQAALAPPSSTSPSAMASSPPSAAPATRTPRQ